MSTKEIHRFPRPIGITSLMVEYHKQISESKVVLYNRIKDSIIHHWIISNGSICGMSFTLDGLSHYLGCDVSYIQLYMRDKLLNTKIWDKDLQESMLNALLGQQVSWTLEDRLDIQNQVEILRNAQGGEYKAFISGELNKVLKLKLESTSSIQNILRNFAGTTNNTLIFNQGNKVEEAEGCTRDQAMAIIYDQMLELNRGIENSDAKYIQSNYQLDDQTIFPEVVASLQGDELGKKEALGLRNAEQKKIIDNYQYYRTKESDKEHHALRREIEEGIDIDEVDPEVVHYEDVDD